MVCGFLIEKGWSWYMGFDFIVVYVIMIYFFLIIVLSVRVEERDCILGIDLRKFVCCMIR